MTFSRTFSVGGEAVAIRDDTGIDTVAVDHHATLVVLVDGATANVTRRRYSPFGEQFGSPPGWPSDREFLGKIKDPTGYSHVEAREYDPTLGRFLSVDPIADFTGSQQINGYAYANNNPVTMSDPSGLFGVFGCGAKCVMDYIGEILATLPSSSSSGGSAGGGGSRMLGAPSPATRPGWVNDFLAKGIAARQAQAQKFDSTKKKVTKRTRCGSDTCIDSGGGARFGKALWGEVEPQAWLGLALAGKGELTDLMGFPGSKALGRTIGVFGGATVQMLDDYDRDDLTDEQKDRRVGLQMGIAAASDLSGWGAGVFTGPVGGFVAAIGVSAGLNAITDAATDNFDWARGTFGNWS